MHGIIRQKNYREASETSHVDVSRVVVRYADGRTLTFMPEAGRKNFSWDDMHHLAKIFTQASSVAEWTEVGEDVAGG